VLLEHLLVPKVQGGGSTSGEDGELSFLYAGFLIK
jgi:hypothetical protein